MSRVTVLPLHDGVQIECIIEQVIARILAEDLSDCPEVPWR